MTSYTGYSGESGNMRLEEESWVCPNDRNLALRAKLGTGWSVHTQKIKSYKKVDQSITCEEQERIVEVIRRAEQIDNTEQQRIGRLVERLENIKNRAQGDGNSTCVLCAESFGGIMNTSGRSICEMCAKAVCAKCVVDTINSKQQQQLFCKICSENRELWKRSGAWFFKSLPQYILPTKSIKKENNRKTVNTITERGAAVTPRSTPTATRIQRISRSDTESDSDDEVSLMRGRRGRKGLDSDSQSLVSSSRGSPLPSGGGAQMSATESGREDDDDRSSGTYSRKSSLYSNTESANFSREGSLKSTVGSSLGDTLETRSNLNVDAVSIKSDCASPQAVTPTNTSVPMQLAPNDEDSSDHGYLGTLEFALKFNDVQSTLNCTIYRAKGLKAMDSNGLSDPYVKLHLLPGASKSSKRRTKTIHKTLNPEFDETLTYEGISIEDLGRKTLRLTVLDEDTFSNDVIGESRIVLKSLQPGNLHQYNLVLEPAQPVEEAEDVALAERGKLQLSLRYNSRQQQLEVCIIQAAGLLPMDANGFSDPFVKLYLKPDKGKKSKHKTKIVKKSLNPVFNEDFSYSVQLRDLAAKTLELTVWDYDAGMKNDFIGGIQLGSNAKGERLKHWFDTLKNPDRTFEKWHILSADLPADL